MSHTLPARLPVLALLSALVSGCASPTPVSPARTMQQSLAAEPAPAPAPVAAQAPAATAHAHVHAPAATPAVAAPASASASRSQASLPVPVGAQRYSLSWDGQLEGSGVRTLTCADAVCTYRTEAQVPGVATLSETSRFSWRDGRVRFAHYERNLQLLFFPQQVHIHREDDGSFSSTRKGKSRRYAGRDDAVDLLSLEIQLRADRMAGRAPRASYPLADVKGITEVSLTRLADETLSVNGASRKTEVYERRDGQRVTTLWLDPAQAFLTVQIVHRDGAETYRMIWQGTAG